MLTLRPAMKTFSTLLLTVALGTFIILVSADLEGVIHGSNAAGGSMLDQRESFRRLMMGERITHVHIVFALRMEEQNSDI